MGNPGAELTRMNRLQSSLYLIVMEFLPGISFSNSPKVDEGNVDLHIPTYKFVLLFYFLYFRRYSFLGI